MTALANVEYGIRLVVYAGFVSTNGLDVYPQIEINDHKTKFEPYVGGIITGNTIGTDNIFAITHNISGSDNNNNVKWVLNKENNSVMVESTGVTADTSIYDTQLEVSHGSYNLFHWTPTTNTPVFLSGSNSDDLWLQISDGTLTFSDTGNGVGLIATANTEYFVRALAKKGFTGKITLYPKLSTGFAGVCGFDTTVIYTNDDSNIVAKYKQRPTYDDAYISKDITNAISYITANKILHPFASFKPMVTFIDDDTSTLTDVNNYASVFTSLGEVGSYAVMTRMLENSIELKNRLLELDTAGFGMLFHCEYQNGDETNYFLNDLNRDLSLIRQNIKLGLRQMAQYGFASNYKHWVTPYGVNDKDIVDVAKEYGLESIISISNNSWVSNTGNVFRYNVPRFSVSTTTPNDFPTIKAAAQRCAAENGWLLIVTHANTWRHNDVVTEMQIKLTSVINYLKNIGFEVAPYSRAYESRKSIFYINEMLM